MILLESCIIKFLTVESLKMSARLLPQANPKPSLA